MCGETMLVETGSDGCLARLALPLITAAPLTMSLCRCTPVKLQDVTSAPKRAPAMNWL